MRRQNGLLAAIAAVLAACGSLDPSADAAVLRREVAARTGSDVPEAPGTAATEPSDEVLALLRAPLTDEAAIQIALRHNHRVRAIAERLGIARADLVQAGRLRNPVLDADARFLFDGGTDLELGLVQPVIDLFHRSLRARLGEHEFAAATAMLTDELVHLVFAVRRAAIDARAAARLVTLQRDALQAAIASHELAVALHAAGNLTDLGLATERAGEGRARLDLAAAELAATEATEPLQRLLGLWGANTEWQLAGELAEDALAGVDLDHVEQRAITRSLELATARARIDAQAQRVGLRSWQQWIPDADFGISAVREPGGEWGLGPRLGVELPLFDDGRAATGQAAHQLRALLHDHVQLAIEIRSAARTLRERTAQLADRARFLREVQLPAREAIVRGTVQQYNAMQIGAFDVLRQRQLQLAETREYVDTLRLAHHARLDLQELLAGGLPPSAFTTMSAPRMPAAGSEAAGPGHE